MSRPCPDRIEAIADLAVGRIDNAGEVELRSHAAGCEGCAREIADLARTGSLLELADPDRVGAVLPQPDTSEFERLSSRLAGERQARRRRGIATGAVTALAAAAAATVLLVSGDSDPVQRISFDTGHPDIGLTAVLTDRQFGTEVEVYVRGIEEGTRCRVWLRGEDGRREAAGSFLYRYGNDSDNAALVAGIDRPSVAALEIRAGQRKFVSPVNAGEGESIE